MELPALDLDGGPVLAAENEERAAISRIEQALTGLGADASPPLGWEARVLAAHPRPRRVFRWRWALALAIPAAALLLWRILLPTPPAIALAMVVTPGGPVVRSASAAALGDRVTVEVRGSKARVLSIYRDGRLFIACPGDARCQASRAQLGVSWTVQDLGSYTIVAGTHATALPAPRGELDADLGALTSAGADHRERRFDIR